MKARLLGGLGDGRMVDVPSPPPPTYTYQHAEMPPGAGGPVPRNEPTPEVVFVEQRYEFRRIEDGVAIYVYAPLG